VYSSEGAANVITVGKLKTRELTTPSTDSNDEEKSVEKRNEKW
jgi:hypothetical protein